MGANYLKFPVTGSILSAYNTGINTDLFDTSDNTLLFYVYPEGYSPIDEALGASGNIRSASGRLTRTSSRERGFEVTTLDEREVTMKVLNQLRTDATAYTITVHDYIEPDSGDFTVREMVMLNPIRPRGGSFRDPDGNRWYRGGFTIELVGADVVAG